MVIRVLLEQILQTNIMRIISQTIIDEILKVNWIKCECQLNFHNYVILGMMI